MKKIWVFLVATFFYGCSSSYTPSDKMLEYMNNMSTEQAAQVMQKRIWELKAPHGICGSRGFWYDNSSDMTVYKDKISMLAHKRGRQIKKKTHSFNDIIVFEKAYFKYDFVFNRINNIFVYSDPLLLPVFPGCNKNDLSEPYKVIDLYIDKLNNLKFIVMDSDFDETMAAIGLLLPDKPVILK